MRDHGHGQRRGDTARWRRLCGRWSADDAAMTARYRAPTGCRAFVRGINGGAVLRLGAKDLRTTPWRPSLHAIGSDRSCVPCASGAAATQAKFASVGATRTAQACRHAGSWAPHAWRPSGRVTGAFAPAALAATGLRRAHPPFAGPACERCRDQPAGCAANAAAMVSRSGVVGRPISLLKVWLSSNRLPPPADAEHCASTWAKPAGSPAWTRAAA